MSATTVFCHILGGNVTVITDLNGNVTNVVCPKFFRVTHGCEKKSEGQGFLKGVLGRVVDKAAGTRASYCEFGDPNHFSLK